MCAPALMIINGVLAAASSVYQEQMQGASYEAQANAADANRRLSELQASEALKEGAREEERFHRQAQQYAAAQEARLAASGAKAAGFVGAATTLLGTAANVWGASPIGGAGASNVSAGSEYFRIVKVKLE